MMLENTDKHRADLRAKLRPLLSERVCIVGMGNKQRGDDGAGCRLIEIRPSDALGFWLDAGVAPENHLESIARANPHAILIVDAVAFGGAPGEFRIMDPATFEGGAVSTHAGSLSMLVEYLSARTQAAIHLIAIQPLRIDLQESLSPAVERSVRELAALLSDKRPYATPRETGPM